MTMTAISFIAVVHTALALPFAGAQREPVTFKDDIRQFIMKGDDTDRVDATITISDASVTLTPKKKGHPAITVPLQAISGITYDRRPRMRKLAPTWGRAEDHFLTVQFKKPDGTGDFFEVELGKNTAPRVIATLEARSGKKIERASGG